MNRSQPALLAAIASIAVLTACSKGGSSASQGAPPLAVDVAAAQRQDIGTYVALDGQIAPLQDSTLSSPQSGNVVAVYVNEGQPVHAGQLLAKIDDSTLRASLAQQQAMVAQSTATLGSSTLQGPVTAAQASNTIVTAQQQLAAARNAVLTDQAAFTSAKSTYDADEKLLKQGYVAQTTFDQAQAAYVLALQTLNTARASQGQAEVALRAAQSQGSNAVPIQNQAIALSRGGLAAAQAQVRLLQNEIAQTNIVAPFSGVVTQRLLDPGAFASPNAPVVRVSQVDTVYINVNVPDDDLTYVHRGTAVTFSSSSLPNRTFSAAITDVNATPTTGTLSYRARLRVPNPDGALRGGMLVSVNVRKEFHAGAIVVPRTAVFATEAGANVFTVVPAAMPPGAGAGGPPAAKGPPPAGMPTIMQAKVVAVKLGIQTDTQTEVISPMIRPGTSIIVTRPDALQDKSTVAVSAPVGGGHAAQ
jgi:multidrug efflux pump subunit AcrA (membrane-fusion protein)